MELVFRKSAADPAAAGLGEIYLTPASNADRQRRDLAALLLEKGPSALLQGDAPVERIVISADPTLDDMLAAAILQRQLRGEPVSPGCQAFARYTGLVREGLRPGQFPLEQSIEGVFLAIRGETEQGKSGLENSETARKFLASWERMASVIFQAADAGHDPFTTPLFAAGPEFARERAFLAKDLDVYRLDFAQGDAWRVQLPGVATRLHGLLLHRPKALLFKYWTRMQCPAPLNGPYPFLAVDWGNGQWVFSTDPVQKLSLKPLAELLQATEPKQTPADGQADPWFDGKPFGHSLVAAPRGGSKMREKKVVRIVKKWCRARPAVPRSRLPLYLAFSVGVLLAVAALVWQVHFREPTLIDVEDLHVFAVGVSNYKNPFFRLGAPARDADAVVEAFQNAEGSKEEKDRLFKSVRCQTLKDDEATRENILVELQAFLSGRVRDDSLVILSFSGHGYIEPKSKKYHFAPYDYQTDLAVSRGLYLADLQRCLSDLPCSVIVLLDTCKSGGANEEEEANENKAMGMDIEKHVNDSWKRLVRDRKGLVVIAACGPDQSAMEAGRWKHGALTLALLEVIQGKYSYSGPEKPRHLPPASGVVTLQDMDSYLTKRVDQLTAELNDPRYRRQLVHTHFTGNVTPSQIPIVRR